MDITETSPHRMFTDSSGIRSPVAPPHPNTPEKPAVPNEVNSRHRSHPPLPDRHRDALTTFGDAYRNEFQQALACIAPNMESVEARIRDELTSEDHRIAEMLRYVASLGGKRLRPALCLLAARWMGRISDETIRLATVVELVHTATLVHDDILDHASLRRHKPTVHVRWDVPSSILIGDWLFTHAYRLANEGESTLPGRWVAVAAQRVCEGEIRQGKSVADWSLSESEYVRMLEDKTGALCGVSCALGAWSAGAPLEVCKELEYFGVQLGTAFQIFDDWLDLWGDSQRSGKTLGTDLSQWKPTLPLLRTLCTLDPVEREAWIARADQDSPDAIAWLKDRIQESDASEYTLGFAREMVRRAVDRIQAISMRLGNEGDIALQSLVRLAQAAVARAA